MTKKINIILLISLLIVTLVGCKTATPTASQTKEDMIGHTYSNKYGHQEIKSLEEIQTFKVNEKDLSKKDRSYIVTGEISLDKDFISIKDKVTVDYRYIPEEGWKIQNIYSVDDSFTQIELKKLLQEDDIKELLRDSYIEYNNGDKYFDWDFEEESEIEKIVIKDRTTDHESMSDVINTEITARNGSEELNADMSLSCSLDLYENKWHIDIVEINDASKELYAGVNTENIKSLLLYEQIPNYINGSDYEGEYSDNWYIEDLEEIANITVLDQNTDLSNKTDIKTVEIELEKDNIKAKGNINISFKYDEGRGWLLENIENTNDMEVTLVNDLDYDINQLKEHLIGNKFKYQGSFWGNYWTIEEGEINSIEIKNQFIQDYGNTLILITYLELEGGTDLILGDAIITYELDKSDNTWKLENISRLNDFEKR